MGVIIALVFIVVASASLLLYFHYQDRHNPTDMQAV